jgi:hypothetical protein
VEIFAAREARRTEPHWGVHVFPLQNAILSDGMVVRDWIISFFLKFNMLVIWFHPAYCLLEHLYRKSYFKQIDWILLTAFTRSWPLCHHGLGLPEESKTTYKFGILKAFKSLFSFSKWKKELFHWQSSLDIERTWARYSTWLNLLWWIKFLGFFYSWEFIYFINF